MFERVKLIKINDHIYLMNDNDEATGYIVLGKEKALVIDTMNGYEDVKAIAETVTQLPIMVVNTHGHLDHIYGNVYFEEAYMNPADYEIAECGYQHPVFVEAIKKAGGKPAKFKAIFPGDKIDLGGLVLEVYSIAGHTPGSIGLLSRADRIFFTGDGIIEQVWMQLEESLPMEQFLENLNKLESIRKDYDYILAGHSRGLEDASLYEDLKQAVQEVCEGKTENDMPYEWFEGTSIAHSYGGENKIRKVVY